MLCDEVGWRLRKHGLYCTILQVQIKDPSLKVISRQKTLSAPTNATKVLQEESLAILERSWRIGDPIRLLSVTGSGLTKHPVVQMSLLEAPEEREKLSKLDAAVDDIRLRFGKDAVRFGVVLGTDIGGRAKTDLREEAENDPY